MDFDMNKCPVCDLIECAYVNNYYDEHTTYHDLISIKAIVPVGESYRSEGDGYVRKVCRCTQCGAWYDFLLS